jgi:hypothetical protein
MIIIVWLTINVWGRTCCFTYTFDTIEYLIPTNIRLGSKETNIIDYNEDLQLTAVDSLMTPVSWLPWLQKLDYMAMMTSIMRSLNKRKSIKIS